MVGMSLMPTYGEIFREPLGKSWVKIGGGRMGIVALIFYNEIISMLTAYSIISLQLF